MIKDIVVRTIFQGENFSPKTAEKITGIKLQSANEIGDISKKGKYKNRALPYGSGIFEAPEEIVFQDRVLWLTTALDGKLEKFKSCGAENIYFDIGYFYTNQCNLFLSKTEISAIAKLGIDFHFSCYEADHS